MMASTDKELWKSIGYARYDFGAVGAFVFSFFGLVASGVASAHVVTTLFAATGVAGATAWDAVAYGVALFLLAEGVAYYIEVYALFETRLRWWLWVLRWVGPGLSAGAGGLAAYSWLPEDYKWLCAITTLILPLFQWGFLSILMDRVRAVHSRRLRDEAPVVMEPTPMQQLVTLYQEVQQRRALDDLERLREMITIDRAQPVLLAQVAEQPTYPTPVAVEATQELATASTEATDDAILSESIVDYAAHSAYGCPSCGTTRSPQGHALAHRYDPGVGRCKACRTMQTLTEGE